MSDWYEWLRIGISEYGQRESGYGKTGWIKEVVLNRYAALRPHIYYKIMGNTIIPNITVAKITVKTCVTTGAFRKAPKTSAISAPLLKGVGTPPYNRLTRNYPTGNIWFDFYVTNFQAVHNFGNMSCCSRSWKRIWLPSGSFFRLNVILRTSFIDTLTLSRGMSRVYHFPFCWCIAKTT